MFSVTAMLVFGPILFAGMVPGDPVTKTSVSEHPHAKAAGPQVMVRPAWGDFDGDGLRDLYVVGGDRADRLFRNLGDGRFADETASAGLEGFTSTRSVQWLDFNRDQHADLFRLDQAGKVQLYQGSSSRVFEHVSLSLGFDLREPALGAEWLDYDGDGWEDLRLELEGKGPVFMHSLAGVGFERVDLGVEATDTAPLESAPGVSLSDDTPAKDITFPDAEGRGVSTARPIEGERRVALVASSDDVELRIPVEKGGQVEANPGLGMSLKADSLKDQGAAGCLQASSVPTLGLLYPISPNLFVDATTGFVGIGTTSPITKLDIRGPLLASSLSGPGFRGFFAQGSIGGVTKIGATSGAGQTRGPLAIQTADLDRIYVDVGGNVGIGTTNPAGKLEIEGDSGLVIDNTIGNASINLYTPTQGDLNFYKAGVFTGELRFDCDANGATLDINDRLNGAQSRLFIAGTGNVGIGATSPEELLHVAGPGGGTNGATVQVGSYTALGELYSSGATVVGDNVKPANPPTDGMEIMQTQPNYGARALRMHLLDGVTFHAQGGSVTAGSPFSNEIMRITNSGNVGIGTTNPAAKLEILDTMRVSRPGNPQHYVELFGASSSADPYINTASGLDLGLRTGGAERVHIVDATGNVGIGTPSPDEKLTVSGTIHITSGGVEFPDTTVQSTAAPWAANGSNVYNTNSGNVGIGTTNPQVKLEVRGDAVGVTKAATGELRAGLFSVSTGGDSGVVETRGPSSVNTLCSNSVGFPNNGAMAVVDGNNVARAGMQINSQGFGVVFGDVKAFRQTNPNDPTTDIWYASIEGPEAAAYMRGTATLSDGKAIVYLPDHFQAVIQIDGMTVQVTPRSAESLGLAVVDRTLGHFTVQELHGGSGNYAFDWRVEAVRAGWENYRVIRPKGEDQVAMASSEVSSR